MAEMQQTIRGTAIIADGISYFGTIILRYTTKKKHEGQCYGRIPETDLATKSFAKVSDLKHYIENGNASFT